MDEVLIAAYFIVGVFERAFIKASVEAGSNKLVRVNWKRAEAQTHTRKRAYATLTHNSTTGARAITLARSTVILERDRHGIVERRI